MQDLLTVQTSIATEISTTLRAKLTSDQIQRVANTYTQDVDAYQSYLKGLYQRQKTTEQGFAESVRHFRQAIELDPTYALAYVGLSDSYGSLGYLNLLPPHEVWPKAKAAAEAALKLDPSLGAAHAALGHAILRYDWDLDRARAELDRATAFNPRHAITHHWRAHLAIASGRRDDILTESRKAVALEPLDLMLNAHLMFMLASAPGQRDELKARIASVREIEPDFWAAHAALGAVHLGEGDPRSGLQELEASLAGSSRMPLALFFKGRTTAMTGYRTEAASALTELEQRAYVPSMWVASIRATLGDRDGALTWLERALREHDGWLIELGAWPSSYQAEPRVQSLLRQIGHQP
jgi:Tfp pilus assembly protein PilF